MPICIECSYPVPQLYHVFHSGSHKGPIPPAVPPKPSPLTSAAATAADGTTRTAPPLDKRRGKVKKESASGTPAGAGPTAAGAGTGARTGGGRGGGGGAGGGSGVGGDVRLTQCPRCKRFADKYVEHDYVVLFIDLVLVKPQVWMPYLSVSTFSTLCYLLQARVQGLQDSQTTWLTMSLVTGIPPSPLQPLTPRRRRYQSIHNPPRDFASSIRCLHHLVPHRTPPPGPDLRPTDHTSADIATILLLPLSLPRHHSQPTRDSTMASEAGWAER